MNKVLQEYKEKANIYYKAKSDKDSAEVELKILCTDIARKVLKYKFSKIVKDGKEYMAVPYYEHMQVNKDSIYLHSDNNIPPFLDIPIKWLSVSDEELEQISAIEEQKHKDKERTYLLRVQAENEKKLKELE